MEWIKNFNFEKHKSSILLLLCFIFSLVLIYKLVILPSSKLINLKNEYKLSEIKYNKENTLNRATLQRLTRLKEEYKLQKEKYNQREEEIKKRSFRNLPEAETYLQNLANQNFLNIKTFGRVETIPNLNKTYLPYIISGAPKKIVKFVKELENGEKIVSLSDTPSKFIISSKGEFTFKIATSILNETTEKSSSKDCFSIDILKNCQIRDIKFLKFNSKTYIIIEYIDDTSLVYYSGEEIEFEAKKLKLLIKDGIPILKLK